jgi:hypothetical protein
MLCGRSHSRARLAQFWPSSSHYLQEIASRLAAWDEAMTSHSEHLEAQPVGTLTPARIDTNEADLAGAMKYNAIGILAPERTTLNTK